MAVLEILTGNGPGQILELRGERAIVGRHPNCVVVLDSAAVSRHHAQILQSHGNYYLEDLRSRNGTYLNGTKITGRTELHESDEIKVCDFVLRFHRQAPSQTPPTIDSLPPTPAEIRIPSDASEPVGRENVTHKIPHNSLWAIGEEPTENPSDRSSVISTINTRSESNLRLRVKPEVKLRAMLEIGASLGKTLKLDDVLQKILACLFRIFPQAEEGFVLLKDTQTDKLVVRATKRRSGREDDSVQISMTIVRQALESHEAILSADAAQDSRFDMSDSLAAYRIRSMMCAPLVGTSGDALGVIQIDTHELGHRFSEEDLDLLASVASQAALAVENAGLHEELLRQRDFERDLEFATQVQLGFLPNARPQAEGYDFFDYYEAAYRVGGDYFDYVPLPDGRIAVALGDVAGKGVPAALLMARLYSSARYHLLTHASTAAALTGLNREIISSGLGHRFITFVLAVLDPATHELTLANAGHLPPLLRDSNRNVQALAQQESGLPLGVLADEQFQEIKRPVNPGDTIVLYTDGVTEAMNAQSKIYSKHRLKRFISRGSEDITELVEGIVEDVEQFGGGRPQRDDICVVAFRRRAEQPRDSDAGTAHE